MGLRERLDRIENPWLGSAIVFAAFVLFALLCFGGYRLVVGDSSGCRLPAVSQVPGGSPFS